MALLKSLGKDSAFISVKDRGGLWYPKEYLTDILVTTELHFRTQTGNGVCHKICVDKIVDNLLKLPVLRSKWNMLVEECDKTQKDDPNFFCIKSSCSTSNKILFICKICCSEIQT